jgi:hypothetical protein
MKNIAIASALMISLSPDDCLSNHQLGSLKRSSRDHYVFSPE